MSEFEDDVFAARRADRSFMNRILEHASPEQREEIQSKYRKLQQNFEEAAQ